MQLAGDLAAHCDLLVELVINSLLDNSPGRNRGNTHDEDIWLGDS